jgi:hypothetical protein
MAVCILSVFVFLLSTVPALKIHVIPHSHVKPGWVETPDDYYTNYVSSMIPNILDLLEADDARHFVWSDVYFF